MLVALEEYHRGCEQQLEQTINIEKNKVVQTLAQLRSEDIFEKSGKNTSERNKDETRNIRQSYTFLTFYPHGIK